MHRTILTGGWTLAVLCLSSSTIVHADPLPSATWTETMSLHSPSITKQYSGENPALAEALSNSLSSSGYSVEGDLTFGSDGPPFIAAHANGSVSNITYQDILHPLTYSATSQSVITFDLKIVATHVPPVPVESIPIVITSSGSLYVKGGCSLFFFCYGASASGSMIVTKDGIEVFNKTASAAVSTESDEAQASLGATKALSLHPETILHGSVTVLARMIRYTNGFSDATASLGPAFEITSAFIPGTEYQYADFFQIEYSPGYWALGDPTPVAPTTWGKIKTLYSRP